MIQQVDCLCAQKLAEKLAHLALEREATDNISVIVVLFRWKGITPNTIGGWRAYNQVLTMHSLRRTETYAHQYQTSPTRAHV